MPDNTILTDDELAEIEARTEAATEGPWRVVAKGNTVKSHAVEGICSGISPKTADADFIAHSRSDVSRLLATIRAQRAVLEFYGDPANHRHTHDWHGQMIVEPSAVDEDGGKRARAILHPATRGEEATRA